MKKLALVFLLMGSAVFAQKQETRQVQDFSAVQVSQSVQLDFTFGGAKSVEVQVQNEGDLQYVKTEVKNGVLQVYIDKPKGVFNTSINGVQVKVSNPTLTGAYVSSSAKFNVKNKVVAKDFKATASSSGKFEADWIQSDNLTLTASSSSKIEGKFEVANSASIEASSSAKIDLDLKGNKVEVTASSSSKIEMEGTAKDVSATVSSSAQIEGKDWTIHTLNAKASSSASMRLTVTKEVIGKASSSGKISIYGSASLVDVKKSSGGKIEIVK
ncbi:GIN domain-containing protein [Myroides odoratus]|uniref:GIN domain-containing protein n=1 Tax=Myroides odoratus TaxID=256 RepID=UPI0039AF6CC8